MYALPFSNHSFLSPVKQSLSPYSHFTELLRIPSALHFGKSSIPPSSHPHSPLATFVSIDHSFFEMHSSLASRNPTLLVFFPNLFVTFQISLTHSSSSFLPRITERSQVFVFSFPYPHSLLWDVIHSPIIYVLSILNLYF